MNYWQVAAGDGRRDYSRIFIKFGVMLMGPGDPGDYFQNKHVYKNLGQGKSGQIRAFAENAKDSDIVVLKKPSRKQWEVLAVGTVRGGYQHLPAFNDVEGWDLQHCRKVEWVMPKGKMIISGLKRGTFNRVNNEGAIQQINKALRSGGPTHPEGLPQITSQLDDEALISGLIDKGLRPKDAEDLAQTIHRIRRLARWYNEKGIDIKEHETKAFLIIPLLLALGWSEQRLKIEWKGIDIAFFEKPYGREKGSNSCIMVLESKRFWAGLTYAESQGKRYAKRFPSCTRMIVTDGCRYKLFERHDDGWKESAYLNILKPTSAHPYEKGVCGAQDVFLSLMVR